MVWFVERLLLVLMVDFLVELLVLMVGFLDFVVQSLALLVELLDLVVELCGGGSGWI